MPKKKNTTASRALVGAGAGASAVSDAPLPPADVIPRQNQSPGRVYQEGREPLGVPQGYQPPGIPSADRLTGGAYARGQVPGSMFTPQIYYKGDELAPIDSGWENILSLQDRMQRIGLLDPNEYQRGWWDVPTQQAYRTVISYANQRGMTAEATLAAMEAMNRRFGGQGKAAKVPPLVIELTNPESVKNMAQELAARVLHRRLSDPEAQQYADTFNAMERQYQQQRYNMMMANRDATEPTVAGEVYQPPSLSDFATTSAKRISEENPAESSSVAGFNAAKAFFNIVRKSGVG